MLDLGFIHALRRNVKMLPRKRHTLFFSATMPNSIRELADQYLDEPHMFIASAGRSEETFDKFLLSRKLSRRIVLRMPHLLAVPSVVRESDLLATVPQSIGLLFRNYAGVRAIDLPFEETVQPPRTTVSQFWSARFDRDPANMWLRGLIAQIFQHSDAARLEAVLTG